MEEKRLKENIQLREKLNKVLRQARRNKKTQTSFDDFSLSVMAAQGPQELFLLLLEEQKKSRIDEIRLCLIDRFHTLLDRLETPCLGTQELDTDRFQCINIARSIERALRITSKLVEVGDKTIKSHRRENGRRKTEGGKRKAE